MTGNAVAIAQSPDDTDIRRALAKTTGWMHAPLLVAGELDAVWMR